MMSCRAPSRCRNVGAGCLAERLQHTAAGLPGGNALRSLFFDPLEPVGPPCARALRRLGDPLLERTIGGTTDPVLILRLARRIDDARDMPGARKHIFDRAAEGLGSKKDRLRRGDVILPRRQVEDWNL